MNRSAVLLDDAGLLKKLLALGLNAEFADAEGRNALHWAALYGQPESVRVLLAHGVDPAIQTQKGETAAEIVRASRERRIASLEERGDTDDPEIAEHMRETIKKSEEVLALLTSV